MPKRKTKEEFIKAAREIHRNKYCYDSVDNYINNKTKVTITCPDHGPFEQSPDSHLRGNGCPKCGNLSKTKDLEQFIKDAIKIHGNKYCYDSVGVYINANTKVTITCPDHGPFEQSPDHHLRRRGCPKCANTTKDLEQFIKDATKIHRNKYCYDSVDNYINNKTKVTITCPDHGPFEQSPNNHLRGNGCPKCGNSISKSEIRFLNYLKVPNKPTNRQVWIGRFKVDGLIKKQKVIYEYLGDWWHGNPKFYSENDIHQRRKVTYGELYKKTIERFNKLVKKTGYRIEYIWESDWLAYEKGLVDTLNIQTH